MPEEKNSDVNISKESAEKYFEEWMTVKTEIQLLGMFRSIKEGDIWWCGVGKNVGTEINGKNARFARPVLVLKKLSRYNFIGIPLTSQLHEGSWYCSFGFKNKTQIAVVAQVRNFSTARLYRRMGTIPNSDLNLVKMALIGLLK